MKQNKFDIGYACIILSGGFSQRMRMPKALLKFSDSENFLQHIVGVYEDAGVNNIIIVLNHNIFEVANLIEIKKNRAVIINNQPQRGRLFSIQLGLKSLTDVSYCFIQNIDSPFVNEEIIGKLYKSILKADYYTPVFENKGGHPILIGTKVMDEIIKEKNTDKSLKDVLLQYDRQKVKMDTDNCLININTPEEYVQYFGNKV